MTYPPFKFGCFLAIALIVSFSACTRNPPQSETLESATQSTWHIELVRTDGSSLHASMPFLGTSSRGDKLVFRFAQPLSKQVKVGCSLLAREQLDQQRPTRPTHPNEKKWRLRADDQTVTPTIRDQIGDVDVLWDITWTLPAGTRRAEAVFPGDFRYRLSVDGLPWDWRREAPCGDSASCADYFYRGSFKKTEQIPFGQCTRPGDFVVVYLPPGRTENSVLALLVESFLPSPPPPCATAFSATLTDGTVLPPEIHGDESPSAKCGATWSIPPDARLVRLDFHVPFRYALSLEEAPLDWQTVLARSQPPKPLQTTPGDANVVCFP